MPLKLYFYLSEPRCKRNLNASRGGFPWIVLRSARLLEFGQNYRNQIVEEAISGPNSPASLVRTLCFRRCEKFADSKNVNRINLFTNATIRDSL